MSTASPGTPRPRQVTFGATLVIVGSLLVVLSAWERVSGLHTLEGQDELRRVIAEPPASDLGLDVGQLADLLRACSYVAAASAAAAAILGGYALARSVGCRWGLAVLALPMLVAGFAVAGLAAVGVVVGTGLLFSTSATAWFRGTAPPTPPTPSSPSQQSVRPTPPARDAGPPLGDAPPTSHPPGGPGQPAAWGSPHPGTTVDDTSRAEAPRPWQDRPPLHTSLPAPPVAAPPRPAAVVWACVLTWVSTGVIGVGLGLTGLVVALAGPEFFTQLREQEPALDQSGYTDGQLRTTVLVLVAVVVPWCVLAAVLAVLAFRRSAWARIALAVSAGLAGALMLAVAISSPAVVLFAIPLGLTVVLLARPEVGAWIRHRP